jgi:hypothetical protein
LLKTDSLKMVFVQVVIISCGHRGPKAAKIATNFYNPVETESTISKFVASEME